MHFRQGRHQEAYRTYSEALEIDPLNCFTNAKLYCNRALVGSKVCHITGALQSLKFMNSDRETRRGH